MATEISPAEHVSPPRKGRKLERLPHPEATSGRIVWEYAISIVAVHLLSLAALIPWFFSWTGVVLLIVGIYFYGGLGVNIAYHRLLTHRSFACPLWMERILVTIAICCLEDAPGSWVATHRLHHNDSDERPDPHSPLVSFFWAHMGWLMYENRDTRSFSAYDRYARDILRDPFYMKLQRGLLPITIYMVHALVYFLAGFIVSLLAHGTWLAATQFGLSLLVWGVFLRTVCVWHITWSVNSLSHVGGYQTYETGDNSRNNWLVAFLTSGEGWHNNHHEDPASASNAHQWWELDPMYWIIRTWEACGLATDVIRPRIHRRR